MEKLISYFVKYPFWSNVLIAATIIGGGYFLFFTNFSNRNKLINWIKREGLIYTNFKFEDLGLKSWVERNN